MGKILQDSLHPEEMRLLCLDVYCEADGLHKNTKTFHQFIAMKGGVW
jgi:hypothetical protein